MIYKHLTQGLLLPQGCRSAHVFFLEDLFPIALISFLCSLLNHSLSAPKCSLYSIVKMFLCHIVLQQPPYFSARQNVLKQKTTNSLMSLILNLPSIFFFKWEVCTWFYLNKFLKLYNSLPFL